MEETLKIHRIQIPIYNDSLQVFFGSRDETIAALKRDGLKDHIADSIASKIDEDATKGCYLYNEAERYHLIWMPRFPSTVDEYATIVHELQHFTFAFLDRRGFMHTESSDEAYSYLIGFVFGEIDMYITASRREKNFEKNTPEKTPEAKKEDFIIWENADFTEKYCHGDFIVFTFNEFLPQGERFVDIQGRLIHNFKSGRNYFRYKDELGHFHERSLKVLCFDPSNDWKLCEQEEWHYLNNNFKYYQ